MMIHKRYASLSERLTLPPEYLRVNVVKEIVTGSVEPAPTNGSVESAPTNSSPSLLSDTLIYMTSIFLREFLSTTCQLVLAARLGGDLFFAGPVVSLLVNIVFRRPLINPFVASLACGSSGDWKKANVAGYPGFDRSKTRWFELFSFWIMLVTAEVSGAVAAAGIRASHDRVFGYEFLKNAASGSGQLYFKANLTADQSCWNRARFAPLTDAAEVPVRMGRSAAIPWFTDDCAGILKWRWWFAEEVGAVLFFIVTYVHIWRWLRWDDMLKNNPTPYLERYWEKIVTFSCASAAVGFMVVIAFPTAHAGIHTSVFLSVYEELTPLQYKHVVSNDQGEAIIRIFGGCVGFVLALWYEFMLAGVDARTGSQASSLDVVLYKFLYTSPPP